MTMPGAIDDVLSSVHYMFIRTALMTTTMRGSLWTTTSWNMPRPPERMVIEPAETTSNNAIEQMVLDEEDSPTV